MPTALPRVQVVFDRPTFEILENVAVAKDESLSRVVYEMVTCALLLSEDLALAEKAEQRLASLTKDDAMTLTQMREWNKNRRKKK